jgi:hypothetical protein
MFEDYKTALTNALVADPYFSDIPVVTERTAELDTIIDKAIAKTNGLCVFVSMPRFNRTKMAVSAHGPYWDSITVMARVFESPIINATGKRALDVSEYVATLWHLFDNFKTAEALIINEISLGTDPRSVNYDVIGETKGGLKYALPQVAKPIASIDGAGNVTLTCATAGAAMFYNINSASTPIPRNGILYTAPFNIGVGSVAKTRGWLAGYQVSQETQVNR